MLCKLIAYIDEYMCRCMLINVQNFVSVLPRLPRVKFAYAVKYICTCMLIKSMTFGRAKLVNVNEFMCMQMKMIIVIKVFLSYV